MSNDSTFKIPDKYSSIDGTDRHVRRLLVPLKGLALPVHGVLAGERRTERKLLLQGHEIESEYASITIDLPESGGLNISEHETTKLNGVVLAKGSSRRERGLEAVGHTTRRWLRRRQGRQAACELMPEDGARVRAIQQRDATERGPSQATSRAAGSLMITLPLLNSNSDTQRWRDGLGCCGLCRLWPSGCCSLLLSAVPLCRCALCWCLCAWSARLLSYVPAAAD